jgi:ATP-dependent exoDNAse (exonuclease V) beta subunit
VKASVFDLQMDPTGNGLQLHRIDNSKDRNFWSGVLPLDERVADAADEAELDDIYETERRLLYVACTRAREHLLLTGKMPTAEYLADFTSMS